jgi:hypothetical protein
MAKLLSKDQKESLWEQVRLKGADLLTDKEVEQLVIMLRSEAFVKALAQVYNRVRYIPINAIRQNLATPEGIQKVMHAQGEVLGFTGAIEAILDLITVQDEDEGEE